MRAKMSLIAALFVMLSVAMTYAQPVSRLQPFGLEGKVVTSLGVYGSLYAGTDGEGVFSPG